MMIQRVFFSESLYAVGSTFSTVDLEPDLSWLILDSVIAHVNWFGAVLLDSKIYNAFDGGIIGLDQRS